MAFLTVSWGGTVGVLLCEWIFLTCNDRWWVWCDGTEVIDGIGWICHRTTTSMYDGFLKHQRVEMLCGNKEGGTDHKKDSEKTRS